MPARSETKNFEFGKVFSQQLGALPIHAALAVTVFASAAVKDEAAGVARLLLAFDAFVLGTVEIAGSGLCHTVLENNSITTPREI